MAKDSQEAVAAAMDVEFEQPKPRLTVSETQVPAIKDWQVGQEYDITIRGKMVAVREGEYSDDEPMEATFIVEDAQVEGGDEDADYED